MMWRKIDSHPKDDESEFLVWNPAYDFPTLVAWDQHGEQFYSPIGGETLTLRPTHWMPLPEPPHDTH